ncbi:MAG: zf-HC2 domain-containing protein [Gemmatimonadota bacterium]
MRPHLPEEELHAWLDDQLSPAQRAELAEHLLACLICRALEAEVRVTRSRSIALLALALPRTSRHAGRQLPARRPIRRLRPMAAAALAIIAAGSSWMAFGPARPTSQPVLALAGVVVSPALMAALIPGTGTGDAATDPAAAAIARSSMLARSVAAGVTPRVVGQRAAVNFAVRPLTTMDPMSELSPSTSGVVWQNASYQEARREAGALAHLEGVPVSTVRLQAPANGGRPASMVRQVLPDGRAVWVIEGTESDVQDVARLMEASGLTIASTRRTAPDYVGPDNDPIRSLRMVTVASYLPYDSLQTLASTRLRMD